MSLAPPTKIDDLKSDFENYSQEVVGQTVGSCQYDAAKVDSWLQEITQHIVPYVSDKLRGYRVVVSTTIAQKNAEFKTSSGCYWDSATDGSLTVIVEAEHISCLVNIFALTIS